jgi:hypothetical protein
MATSFTSALSSPPLQCSDHTRSNQYYYDRNAAAGSDDDDSSCRTGMTTVKVSNVSEEKRQEVSTYWFLPLQGS